MQSSTTIPMLGLVAVFVVGVLVGWIASRNGNFGNLKIAFEKPDVTSSSGHAFFVGKTVMASNLKCECGSPWRFREPGGQPEQGSQPMPAGDSSIRKKCGRTIDPREMPKLESESRLSLQGIKRAA
jgi:hypothetical protein